MGKLYIFGIGGTGARVIRAFTMLCAAGVEVKNASSVVPIIIDPDATNGDVLDKCLNLLNLYKDIRREIQPEGPGYFRTEFQTLVDAIKGGDSDITGKVNNSFRFDMGGTIDISFREYIDFFNLGEKNKKLLQLLYTEKNLDDYLTKGFLGNPNVGSIVLNKIKETEAFKYFCNSFNDGDRIFIVSSIFGGTGASGFPLLLKNFRNAHDISGAQAISNAPIGATTVLPYFKVTPDESSNIDSDNFVTKAKAALSYYKENLTGLNALYYVGDEQLQSYKNVEGGSFQRNDAHLVELIGATSIFHFMEYTNSTFEGTAKCHEFAISPDSGTESILNFDHLGGDTKELIGKKMSNFYLFSRFINEHFDPEDKQPFLKTIKIDSSYKSNPFFKNLKKFTGDNYDRWLVEMESNKRAAKFFNKPVDNNLANFLNTKPIEKSFFSGGFTFDHFDKKFNILTQKSASKYSSSRAGENLLKLANDGLSSLIDEKIKNF